MVATLPFAEASTLFQQLDLSTAWDGEANRGTVQADVSMYVCPVHMDWNGRDAIGFTTYIGIAGLGADAGDLPNDHPRAGFFGYTRQVTRRDIADGLGNTIAVMETMADNGPWAAGGWPTLRWVDGNESDFVGAGQPFGARHKTDTFFRSNPVVANAAFADSSVRTLPSAVDATVFRALVTIAGAEQVRTDF